jgi:hypothetical protein
MTYFGGNIAEDGAACCGGKKCEADENLLRTHREILLLFLEKNVWCLKTLLSLESVEKMVLDCGLYMEYTRPKGVYDAGLLKFT